MKFGGIPFFENHAAPSKTVHAAATHFLELFGAMKRFVREELPPFPDRGLSEEKFRTLLSLRLLGRGSLKALAAHDGLSPSAQCIMLERLVEEGFAARSRDDRDRRRVIYALSPEGVGVIDEEIERRSAALGARLSALGEAEQEAFARAVEILLNGLAKMRDEAAVEQQVQEEQKR